MGLGIPQPGGAGGAFGPPGTTAAGSQFSPPSMNMNMGGAGMGSIGGGGGSQMVSSGSGFGPPGYTPSSGYAPQQPQQSSMGMMSSSSGYNPPMPASGAYMGGGSFGPPSGPPLAPSSMTR